MHMCAIRKFSAALLLGCAAFGPTQATGQTTHPMMCRGGGAMTAMITFTQQQAHVTSHIVISFRKSPVAASARPPGPGECAWLDRPISPKEPFALWRSQGGHLLPIEQLQIRAGSVHILREGSDLAPVLQAVRRGTIFHVHARLNTSHNRFAIVRVGP